MRSWEDWERSRLRKAKGEAKRRVDFEGWFGQCCVAPDGTLTPPPAEEVRITISGMNSPISSGSDGGSGPFDAEIGAYDKAQTPPLLKPVGSKTAARSSSRPSGTGEMAVRIDAAQWFKK